jgi:hypothetical protein
MYVCDVLATGVSSRVARGGAGVRCVPALVALVACGASDGGVPSARPPPVPCERTLDATPVVQSGPLCVAAAALQAMYARAGSPENAGNATTPLRDLARSVVVRPEGVDLYDLQRELRVRGWESLVFTGPPEAGARLVEAGHAPVAMVRDARGRHAVTMVGVRRAAAAKEAHGTTARCGEVQSVEVLDPRDGSRAWRDEPQFITAQDAEQWVVVFPTGTLDTLDDARFPTPIAQAVDRRFRAGALVRAARAFPPGHVDAARLIEEAARVDPTSPEVTAALQ